MSDSFKRYTITSALPYANGPKHIGHLAGAYLPADVYVRYLRLRKRDVIFVCGSDEHGAAITLQAMAEKSTPKEIVDKYHLLVKHCFEQFGISFDIYHRTTSALHHETAQEFFSNMNDKGLLTESISEQYYDEEAATFLADRYIVGTCPNCNFEHAYGDQCERCGTSLSPSELIHPRSVLSGKPPILKSTKLWYLPLQDYEEFLRDWILEGHKEDWKTNVYGQCKSWIDGGLHPRAVTRDLDWGVKVPLPDAAGKVLYVWFDAPIGYISATKQWALDHHTSWEPYWKDKDTKLVHFIGKDNIVFHCIIFPVMLHAHGDFILPDNVPSNEFMNLEGSKMSTSRHWSVEMHEYLEAFPDQPDALRYCLIANAPETKDSEFTWKDFQVKNNSELVGILGNLVNRVTVLTHKYFEGMVPGASANHVIADEIIRLRNAVSSSLEQYRFREAMAEMMNVARLGNKYLADTEPWKMVKHDLPGTAQVIHDGLQIIANLAILCEPFLPFTSGKLNAMLNLKQEYSWEDIGRMDLLAVGHLIQPAAILFDKIEDPIIDEQLAKLHAKHQTMESTEKQEPTVEPQKPEISIDEFAKMDIRTGVILSAEKVEKADKLLKLEVDLGFEKRTIVSGIALHFKPEELPGKKVSVLANLAPRTIRGIVSKGMILLADRNDGKLVFVNADDEVNSGALIK
jgi:methionyl-tRNA synthetase